MMGIATLKNPRAMRIAARTRDGLDDATLERKINKGFRPKHWLTAEGILPPIRSIPPTVGDNACAHRDWAWLKEVWLARESSDERDRMLAECEKHLQSKENTDGKSTEE